MYRYYPMHEFGYFGSGGVTGLLLLALIVVCVVLLYRYYANGQKDRNATTPPSDALSILRERYARGEISTEEFEERKKTLSE